MIDKTHSSEQELNHSTHEELEKLRTEVANLKRQIEDLRSDLRYYELQATKSYWTVLLVLNSAQVLSPTP